MTRLRFASVLAAISAATFVAATAFAVPSLNVRSKYNPAADAIEWEIMVTQDGAGFLAIEAPFTLTQDTTGALGIPIDLRANSSASQTTHSAGDDNGAANQTWYYNVDTDGTTLLWNTQEDAANLAQNVGTNPFTIPPNLVTEGLWMDTANSRLFAALGSDTEMPDADPDLPGTQIRTLHFASNDGILHWNNLVIIESGVPGGGAGGVTLTGFKSSILKGDLNGSGDVNFGDLYGLGLAISNPIIIFPPYPGLDGEARGDMNNSGGANPANFGDLAAFGNCLQFDVCPPMEMGGAGAGGGDGGVGVSGVPEPATIAILALTLLGIVGFVRRRP